MVESVDFIELIDSEDGDALLSDEEGAFDEAPPFEEVPPAPAETALEPPPVSEEAAPPSALPLLPEAAESVEDVEKAENVENVENEENPDAVDLEGALGSLAAYFDTRSQLEDSSELELAGIETFALSPITSSSGLKGVLLDVIGPYDNVVTQYKYQQTNNSYYTYVNEITPDYPWIASAALFIALIVSLFSLLKRSFSSWLK